MGTNGDNRTHEKATSCNQADVDWTTEDASFWVAGHRLLRLNEKSLEPLIETDADETMMVNYGGDDAGEISAVWSNIVLRKPSAIHIVHALVAQGGLTPTTNSEKTGRSLCGKHGLRVLH